MDRPGDVAGKAAIAEVYSFARPCLLNHISAKVVHLNYQHIHRYEPLLDLPMLAEQLFLT